MRNFVIAFALASAVALPAIASDETYIDEMGVKWAMTQEQPEWTDAPAADQLINGRTIEGGPGFSYTGDGWASLDGWMRGDPTLRHWVMHRFDLDADGWLADDEAQMARRGFYQIADTNRSDRITSEEFVAGWSVVRQELRSFYAVDLHDA